MLSAELPSLTTGLRGLAYWQVEVTGPNRDLHSGHFGGAVANPINVLCEMIAKMTDEDGRIASVCTENTGYLITESRNDVAIALLAKLTKAAEILSDLGGGQAQQLSQLERRNAVDTVFHKLIQHTKVTGHTADNIVGYFNSLQKNLSLFVFFIKPLY